MNSELYSFIRESLGKGMSRQEIADALAKGGWEQDEIQECLAAFAPVDFPVPVPQRKTSWEAREAFFYLVTFLALYVSGISLGSLWFSFVNVWLPDPLRGEYVDPSLSGFRIAAASLLVAFPLFALLTRRMRIAMVYNTEQKRSAVGRWLTYATLVIAAAIIAGDLIAVLYNFLGGELTLRFVLKALIVFGIAGMVFGYYLSLVREEEKEKNKAMVLSMLRLSNVHRSRVFARAVIVLAALSVAYGLFLIGSPSSQRARAFDLQRVNDLQQITGVVSAYFDTAQKLPDDLAALEKTPYFYASSLRDPNTKNPYEYRVKGETMFEVCAVFETDSSLYPAKNTMPFGMRESWDHGAGPTCFERAVLKKPAVKTELMP